MRYVVDNDLHIHSGLSLCSDDPLQNAERILQYAKDNNLKTVCVTDHFWDETVDGASNWYKMQDYSHIAQIKPLPQTDGIKFLFGCETDLNCNLTAGISKDKCAEFQFIIIPTTHFHMKGFTLKEEELQSANTRAKAWVNRLDAVLNMDLPFHKVGIAHLTCGLIAPTKEEYLDTLRLIPESDMIRLFKKAAKLGVGIEINAFDMLFKYGGQDIVLRPYKIAKECGCKFYLGSDSHHPDFFDDALRAFNKAIDLLGLTEDDKFLPGE